jgi:hypothetical protein
MGPLGVVRKAGPKRLIREEDARDGCRRKPSIKAFRGFYRTDLAA